METLDKERKIENINKLNLVKEDNISCKVFTHNNIKKEKRKVIENPKQYVYMDMETKGKILWKEIEENLSKLLRISQNKVEGEEGIRNKRE